MASSSGSIPEPSLHQIDNDFLESIRGPFTDGPSTLGVFVELARFWSPGDDRPEDIETHLLFFPTIQEVDKTTHSHRRLDLVVQRRGGITRQNQVSEISRHIENHWETLDADERALVRGLDDTDERTVAQYKIQDVVSEELAKSYHVDFNSALNSDLTKSAKRPRVEIRALSTQQYDAICAHENSMCFHFPEKKGAKDWFIKKIGVEEPATTEDLTSEKNTRKKKRPKKKRSERGGSRDQNVATDTASNENKTQELSRSGDEAETAAEGSTEETWSQSERRGNLLSSNRSPTDESLAARLTQTTEAFESLGVERRTPSAVGRQGKGTMREDSTAEEASASRESRIPTPHARLFHGKRHHAPAWKP